MTDAEGRPWNADRAVGPREHFTPSELRSILRELELRQNRHDAALLTVGVDSLLRCVDLLQLQVRDVTNASGAVIEDIYCRQQKTKRNVGPTLTPRAIEALAKWINASQKAPDHYLFTRTKNSAAAPIGDSAFRDVIKGWAGLIGLDPEPYSTHSLRRTKPHFMFREGVAIAYISELLGHKDTATTLRYLGITLEEARHFARAHDIWAQSKCRGSARTLKANGEPIKGPVNCDVFKTGGPDIHHHLAHAHASIQSLTAEIGNIRAENQSILACMHKLLALTSNRNDRKE